MKKFFLLILGGIILLTSQSCIAFTPKRIVVFGDSYSDNGNTFRVSQDTYPTDKRYWQGRFSNGPVWSEYLAKDFGLNPNDPKQFMDYAYGQAQANGSLVFQTHNKKQQFNFTVPDIHQQLDEYLAQTKHNVHDTLYILFIGANDLFNQKHLANIDQAKFISRTLAAQANLINTLQQLDAKHFLVVNMRDLTAAPIAKAAAEKLANNNSNVSNQQVLDNINRVIIAYNKALIKKFSDLHQVKIFNVFEFDQQQLKKAKVTNKACYVNHGNYINPQGPACKNPKNYFFYDRIHPTTTIHKAMAKAVYLDLTANHSSHTRQ
ncbi:MAG: SGNH/GDSL hydrolase family protein [Coxiellaceae bacterium]|nr:SGNH/GDSL hydrolase family protein [Coxiellaceae bacterium]